MSTAASTADPGLHRNAIGLREVLFQSITAMAPGAAIAASIPAGAAFAGGSLPLSVLIALVACLLSALCIGELARHLPAAGSVATYSAQGLHPTIGFLVAWGYVFVETLVPPLLFLQLGFTAAGTLHEEISGLSAGLWWPWVILGAIVILAAGYYGVHASAELGTILGAFEVAVFLLLGALFVVKAGSANTLSVFTTAHTPAEHAGAAGIVAGSVYTVLAFSGFEAAAPLAEEARDPRRTVRRAVVGAALGIGLVYVFTTYAVSVAFGPDKFSTFSGSGPASWQGFTRTAYGVFWILVFLAIINSCIANANAGANVSTRTAYALARIRLLPTAFTRLHPTHRSPVAAVLAQFGIGLVVALGLGAYYDPVTAFLLIATMIVLVVVTIYMVVDAACIGYFLRRRRQDFNPFLHGVVPVLGIVAFIPALLTAAGLPVFSFITKLAAPVSYAGPVVAVWMLIGLAYLAYLSRRAPERVVDVGRVHLADDVEEQEAVR